MKRYHVLGVAILSGLVIGLSVSKAADKAPQEAQALVKPAAVKLVYVQPVFYTVSNK